MSKWGQRVELSEPEIKILLDLAAKELLRQITHNCIDPKLANLVEKAARALSKIKTTQTT